MLKPLNDKIVVKLLEHEEHACGLIVLKQTSAVSLCQVLSVGEEECDIHVGDQVLATTERMTNTVQGYVVDKKDVLGIIVD